MQITARKLISAVSVSERIWFCIKENLIVSDELLGRIRWWTQWKKEKSKFLHKIKKKKIRIPKGLWEKLRGWEKGREIGSNSVGFGRGGFGSGGRKTTGSKTKEM